MNGGEGMKEPGFGTIKKLNWSSTVWPGSPLSRTSMITPLNPSGVGVSDFSIAPPITAAETAVNGVLKLLIFEPNTSDSYRRSPTYPGGFAFALE
jgi:hypothetical protein